jgi:hypothetical protein
VRRSDVGNAALERIGKLVAPIAQIAQVTVAFAFGLTIESNSSISFEERNRRLDLILAGQ